MTSIIPKGYINRFHRETWSCREGQKHKIIEKNGLSHTLCEQKKKIS